VRLQIETVFEASKFYFSSVLALSMKITIYNIYCFLVVKY
jgi:hypothetical protein